MNDLSAILRQARREERRERLLGNLHRPWCWLTGHRWVYKMDLHGGALCERCPAFKRA